MRFAQLHGKMREDSHKKGFAQDFGRKRVSSGTSISTLAALARALSFPCGPFFFLPPPPGKWDRSVPLPPPSVGPPIREITSPHMAIEWDFRNAIAA